MAFFAVTTAAVIIITYLPFSTRTTKNPALHVPPSGSDFVLGGRLSPGAPLAQVVSLETGGGPAPGLLAGSLGRELRPAGQPVLLLTSSQATGRHSGKQAGASGFPGLATSSLLCRCPPGRGWGGSEGHPAPSQAVSLPAGSHTVSC